MYIYKTLTNNPEIWTTASLRDVFNSLDEDDREEFDNDFNTFETAQLWQCGGDLEYIGETIDNPQRAIYPYYYNTEDNTIMTAMDVYKTFLKFNHDGLFVDYIKWADCLVPIK